MEAFRNLRNKGDLIDRKIYSYNIIRGMFALCVLAYHLNGNEGWSFGILNPLFEYATLYMTGFFMLSGFVLSYNYQNFEFFEKDNLFAFYKKRLQAVLPVYWLIYFFFLVLRKEGFYDVVISFPIQFILLQEFEHYSFLQNDGMWFLSVMLICYLLFPLLLYILKKVCEKTTFFIILYIIAFTLPLIGTRFALNIYTNVFYRVIEFCIGILLFLLISSDKKTKKSDIYIYIYR